MGDLRKKIIPNSRLFLQILNLIKEIKIHKQIKMNLIVLFLVITVFALESGASPLNKRKHATMEKGKVLDAAKRSGFEKEIVLQGDELMPNEEFHELFDKHRRMKKRGLAADDLLFVVQGDELLSRSQYDDLFGKRTEKRAMGMAGTDFLWPNGIVYYDIHESILNGEEYWLKEMLSFIINGMLQWKRHTCLRFVRATTGHRLTFLNCGAIDPGLNETCIAQIGYQKEFNVWSDQLVCLGKGCGITAVHEIGHALGLVHEQQRPDRDRYLTMNLANVNPHQIHNFNTKTDVDTQGVPYDYMSVMHYPGNVFSKNGGLTMLTIDPSFQTWLGRREISPWDAIMINKMYNCPQQYIDQNLHVEEKS